MIAGAAETNPKYQDFIRQNQGSRLQHMFGSLESMLQPGHCVLHRDGMNCCVNPREDNISLGVTGSPCNPFSTQRTKRFADGSISSHAMSDTTMESVIGFYTKWEPHAGITEQVSGFCMRTSHSDPETPLQKSLASTFFII